MMTDRIKTIRLPEPSNFDSDNFVYGDDTNVPTMPPKPMNLKQAVKYSVDTFGETYKMLEKTDGKPMQDEQEQSVWIKVPDWIYIGSKEVEIRYQRPDGEWYQSTFFPCEKHELDKQVIAQARQDERQAVVEKIDLIISRHKKEHWCRFNDGEQNCECYLEGLNRVKRQLAQLEKE